MLLEFPMSPVSGPGAVPPAHPAAAPDADRSGPRHPTVDEKTLKCVQEAVAGGVPEMDEACVAALASVSAALSGEAALVAAAVEAALKGSRQERASAPR